MELAQELREVIAVIERMNPTWERFEGDEVGFTGEHDDRIYTCRIRHFDLGGEYTRDESMRIRVVAHVGGRIESYVDGEEKRRYVFGATEEVEIVSRHYDSAANPAEYGYLRDFVKRTVTNLTRELIERREEARRKWLGR